MTLYLAVVIVDNQFLSDGTLKYVKSVPHIIRTVETTIIEVHNGEGRHGVPKHGRQLWRDVAADVGFTSDTDNVFGETIKDALCSVQYVNRLLAESRVIHPETIFRSSGRCHPDGWLVLVEQCTGRWSRPERCHLFSTKANLRTSAPRTSSKVNDGIVIFHFEKMFG